MAKLHTLCGNLAASVEKCSDVLFLMDPFIVGENPVIIGPLTAGKNPVIIELKGLPLKTRVV